TIERVRPGKVAHVVAARRRCSLERQAEGQTLPFADHVDTRRIADAAGDEPVVNRAWINNLEAVHRDDDIARLEPGFRRGTVRVDACHERASYPVEAEALGDVTRYGFEPRAEPG